MSLRINYTGSPIRSMVALGSALGIEPSRLQYVAANIGDFYSSFTVPKKDGTERTIQAPKSELKRIQRRINSRIFELCQFPHFMQGSIRDVNQPRDFVRNAQAHSKASTVIAADIEKFYPSVRPGHVTDIFKYFFAFSDDVTKVLVSITTLGGELPQGAPTSSYVANLVFYDDEPRLVADFHRINLTYTRLIDDITVSSSSKLSTQRRSWVVNKIRGMVSGKGFRLHKGKLSVRDTGSAGAKVYVTGLWIDRGHPRLSPDFCNRVRSMVYRCKKGYESGHQNEPDFHSSHNTASGRVALMTRLGHGDGHKYRATLKANQPEYGPKTANKLAKFCYRFSEKKRPWRRQACIRKTLPSPYVLFVCFESYGARSSKQPEKSAGQIPPKV